MQDRDFAAARDHLIEEIEEEARLTQSWTGRDRFADRVMAAMARVPRHAFVLEGDEPYAYINRPRGIGHGQTISQPYIVALMTDMLDLGPADRVLEIGAGSGYQAAVLAELAGHVYSVEVVAALAETAAARLERLKYASVSVRAGDGYLGWPEEAPFDAIMVTAAPESVPAALVEQLKPGGRMAIPVGRPHETQLLLLVRKDADGHPTRQSLLPVAFVPMVRARRPAD